MRQIVFNEKIEDWRQYFGISYACYASFGGTLFILLLHTIFGDNINYSFINPITSIILPLIVFISYMPTIFEPLKQQKTKKIIMWTVVCILAIFASKVLFRFIENNFIVFLGHEGLKNFNSESLSNQLSKPNVWLQTYSILSMCLIGPFVEEVTYRVCLFTTLRKRIGIFAHLITAILFGFQHISIAVLLYNRPLEFLYIFSYIGFSFVLTIIYEKTKTPIPGIISHILINCVGVI
ncbi:MAG: CPBP family intramembrane metalloprotease [Oscillospiraceae bacterium]|jgi:membrane protease YdiL (CAAX protease family)|nr:CPBP family intramembrane metalloprotease [Oscillospiraceae bacterium]